MMEMTILYTFHPLKANEASFIQTLKMAQEKMAKVICFSTVEKKEDLDEAYLHLLALQGRFQSLIHHWQPLNLCIERVIKVGKLREEFRLFLKEKNIDVIICQSGIAGLEESVLSTCLPKSNKKPLLLTW